MGKGRRAKRSGGSASGKRGTGGSIAAGPIHSARPRGGSTRLEGPLARVAAPRPPPGPAAEAPPPTCRQPRAHLRPAESWRQCISGVSSPPGLGSPARSLPGAAPAGFLAGAAPADPWRPRRDPRVSPTAPLRLAARRDVTRPRRLLPGAA